VDAPLSIGRFSQTLAVDWKFFFSIDFLSSLKSFFYPSEFCGLPPVFFQSPGVGPHNFPCSWAPLFFRSFLSLLLTLNLSGYHRHFVARVLPSVFVVLLAPLTLASSPQFFLGQTESKRHGIGSGSRSPVLMPFFSAFLSRLSDAGHLRFYPQISRLRLPVVVFIEI